MGRIRKAASILKRGGVSYYSKPESQAKAAKAQAELADVGAKVAGEQAAAIARALQEDEADGHWYLEEIAEEEAEAVPWARQPAPGGGIKAARDRRTRHVS